MPGKCPLQAGDADSGGYEDSSGRRKSRIGGLWRRAGSAALHPGIGTALTVTTALTTAAMAQAQRGTPRERTFGRHCRGHAGWRFSRASWARRSSRRSGLSASGHGPPPRMCELRGQRRRSQRIAPARPKRCSTCATSASWSGRATRQEARADRHAAAGSGRAGRAWRLPCLRPLADAAFGGRARTCRRGAAREGRSASTWWSRRQIGAPLEVQGRKTRRACHRALPIAVRDAAHAGPAEAREPAACAPTTRRCSA